MAHPFLFLSYLSFLLMKLGQRLPCFCSLSAAWDLRKYTHLCGPLWESNQDAKDVFNNVDFLRLSVILCLENQPSWQMQVHCLYTQSLSLIASVGPSLSLSHGFCTAFQIHPNLCLYRKQICLKDLKQLCSTCILHYLHFMEFKCVLWKQAPNTGGWFRNRLGRNEDVGNKYDQSLLCICVKNGQAKPWYCTINRSKRLILIEVIGIHFMVFCSYLSIINIWFFIIFKFHFIQLINIHKYISKMKK